MRSTLILILKTLFWLHCIVRSLIIKDGETHIHGNLLPKYIPREAKSSSSSSNDSLSSNNSSDSGDSVFECFNDDGNNK